MFEDREGLELELEILRQNKELAKQLRFPLKDILIINERIAEVVEKLRDLKG